MSIRQHRPCCINQRGISMVELMIAMLLGLVLTGSMLQLFSSNKSSFMNMEGLSRIQDNARAGLERIKTRIRMSGYMGCSNLDILDPNNVTGPASPVIFNKNVQITGTDNDTNTGNLIVDGTDTVNIIAAGATDTAMSTDMTSTTSDISLTSNPGNFKTNALVIVSDCESTDIFRATDVSVSGSNIIIKHATNMGGNQVNNTSQLSKAYLVNNTRVMPMQDLTFSVEDTGRSDESGNAIQSLFETPAGGSRIEIMTGVEDMQITYGEDTSKNGEADSYLPAATVASWANVVSVRVNLLVSTDHGIGPDTRPYLDLGGTLQATDRRMRRTFTTTIGLRNRSS